MNSETNSGENSTLQMESDISPRISIPQLIQNLTKLDRQVVSREIVEHLEAKLMVSEAKIAALQSDLDAKEDERKLYYDKFKQYGRENRELKKELAEMETNRKPKSSVSKKTGEGKVISQTPKRTETASTSQAAPVASSEPKLGISIAEIRGLLEPTVTSSTSQTPPAAFQAKPVSSRMTGLDHPTKPKEPKTIDPTDVPSANPPSNGQNATVVDTSQQNTEATNVLPVVSMVFYNIESGTMIEKINFSFRLPNQKKIYL